MLFGQQGGSPFGKIVLLYYTMMIAYEDSYQLSIIFGHALSVLRKYGIYVFGHFKDWTKETHSGWN